MQHPWVFVDDSEFGKGLFAREDLHALQTLCEYTGPRLPVSQLRPGTHCAFHIPGTKTFIDGGAEYTPNAPRCVASFANHSTNPNAELQYWPVGRKKQVMLVTKERIPRGGEIRIDYNSGGNTFWDESPADTPWREAVHREPPASMPTQPQPEINHMENIVFAELRAKYARIAKKHKGEVLLKRGRRVLSRLVLVEPSTGEAIDHSGTVISLPRDIPEDCYVV